MKSNLNAFFQRFTRQAREERRLLEAGKDPESKIQSPLQRAAARLIAGFFALMLLFTIVSRAAAGMTVPLVQTDTAKSGIINQRIELTGVIRPLEDMDILLPGNLYVTNVKAEVGQRMEEGDVLLEFDLEDVLAQLGEQRNSLAIAEVKLAITENGASTDSTALQAAELNLKQARDDYDRLEAKLGRSAARAQEDYASAEADLKEAKTKYTETLSKAKQDMTDAANLKRDNAKKGLDEAKKSADEAITQAQSAIETAKDNANESIATALYSYETVQLRDNASGMEIQRAYDQWQSAIEKGRKSVESAQAALETTKTKQNEKIADAQKAYDDALADSRSAAAGQNLEEQQAVVSAQNSVKSAEKALANARRSLEDNGASLDDQLLSASRNVATAQRNLEQAQRDAAEKARSGENSAMQTNIDKITQRAQIASLKKTIDSLEEIVAMDGQLAAPIAGTVQAVTRTGKTQDRVAVATLSRNDMGFRFEAKTDSRTAENLSYGDGGWLSYRENGASQRAQGSIYDIGAADEDNNCLVFIALPEGSYPSGANGTLTITRTGERQNTCLPVSALRSDNDGDYVFVVREKKTVTGLEYSAARMDVTVLDRDSSLVSVQSGLARDDRVVTGANKPISEGDRVRVEN
ncbi:MAG: hypothetical protein FWE98_03485 [Oscillospiraceae bacterium]|nr:hypothetical protein [Oscillospiraceae bacterium]